MNEQNIDQQGQEGQAQPEQEPAKKAKSGGGKGGGALKKAYNSVDAGALVLVLSAPMILLSRYFWSISSGETNVRDIYKLALQNSFIGLFISIVFEKPHVCFASAAGSIVFLTFNYIINPSIEHSDALTDTFKSFRRYSASTIMSKLANLVPLIKVTQSFEDEYGINKPKAQRVVVRRERPTVDAEDEVVEDEVIEDNILYDEDGADEGCEDTEEVNVKETAPQIPPLPPMPTGPPGLPPNMTHINIPPGMAGVPTLGAPPIGVPGVPPLGMPTPGLPPLNGVGVAGLPPLPPLNNNPAGPVQGIPGVPMGAPPPVQGAGMQTVGGVGADGAANGGGGIGNSISSGFAGMADVASPIGDMGLPMGQPHNGKPSLKPPLPQRGAIPKPLDPSQIEIGDEFE